MPLAVMLILYLPTGRNGSEYRPDSFEVVVVAELVSTFVALTVAFGITPPCGSVTDPKMVARFSCAALGAIKAKADSNEAAVSVSSRRVGVLAAIISTSWRNYDLLPLPDFAD